ncbi:Glycerol-3-phosphate acyltransferase [Bienertia sinuspersici]
MQSLGSSLIKVIPPESSLYVGRRMDTPCMGIMHPLIHQIEVQILTWVEPPPEPADLLLTMTMPLEVKRVSRLRSEAYLDTLSSIPDLMSTRLPNFTPNLQLISFLVWNVQRSGSKAFVAALKEVIWVNKPSVIALLETHMDGEHAQHIANVINYAGHLRVDAQGFSGGIWVYWKPNLVTIDHMNQSNQHITMQISRVGEEP